MKKSFIAISAACILMLSLASCGESNDSGVVESTMPTIAVNSSSASSNISKPAEKKDTSTASKASSSISNSASKATEKPTDSTKATEKEDSDLKTINGVIISSDSLLEIKTSDGNTYLFSMDFTADDDYTNIISNGNYVTVKYTGEIVGDDLGSAKDVILISEGDGTDSVENNDSYSDDNYLYSDYSDEDY